MDQVSKVCDVIRDKYYSRFIQGIQHYGGVEFTNEGHATVALLAFPLGIIWGLGLGLFLLSENYNDFGLYMVFMSFFHYSEYITVAKHNPKKLSPECK
jgi:hypothetical protein